jgi:hypothetical protein
MRCRVRVGGSSVDQMTLEARVGRLEDDPPIELDSVDLSVAGVGPLRATFAEIFAYIATVEGAVPQNVAEITTLLPDLDDQERRFLTVWSSHELAHAAIFDSLRAELGLADSGPATSARSAPLRPRRSFQAAGALSASRWLQDVFKLLYLSRGAMHEHMTYDCYRHLGAHFAAFGEDALVRTVTEPIRRQEAAHLGYYRLAAATHRARLSPTQIALARWITVHTYTPVGTAPCGKGPTWRVFAGLAGDDMDAVLDAVEVIADQLLGDGTRTLPHFVHDAMADCREQSHGRPARAGAPWR